MSIRQEILAAKDEATPVDKYAAGRNAAIKLFASKAKFSSRPWKDELTSAFKLANKCSPGRIGSDLFWALKGFFDFWENVENDVVCDFICDAINKDVNELVKKDLMNRAGGFSVEEVNSQYELNYPEIRGDYVLMFWPAAVVKAGGDAAAIMREAGDDET